MKQQITKLNADVDAVSGRLIESLDKRDHLTGKLLRKFDILTAILKSLSLNISEFEFFHVFDVIIKNIIVKILRQCVMQL